MSDQERKYPSEDFENAFGGSGSLVADCGFCDRTYFACHRDNDYEEGELEELRELSRKHPDRYIESQYESISNGTINGKIYVHECKCGGARPYEDFIWDHKFQIAAYLKSRTERELIIAEQHSKVADQINDTVRRKGK